MSIDKVNYGERFLSCFQAKFKLRRENVEPDMAWYNVLYNMNRLTKMAELGIIFLRRKHTIHWYQSLFTIIYKYAVPLFLGHPV